MKGIIQHGACDSRRQGWATQEASLSPFFHKDWCTRCHSCMTQTSFNLPVCWCSHLPVNSTKAVLDSDKADATPATPQGWLQRWASGHVVQDSWKQRDGSVLQGNETKSSLPFVELTDKLQVQQLFIVSLLSLQDQRLLYFLLLFLLNHANTRPPQHTAL